MKPDPSRIMELASAFYGSCILFAASDLGIFSLLAQKSEGEVEDISAALDLNKRGTQLLLDACTALGLLMKDGEKYRNAPDTAIFLVPGAPGDLSQAIRYNRDVYAAWGRLTDLVLTGKPVERPSLHLGDDASRTRAFVMSMHGRALGIGGTVVPRLDLKGRKQLLDIGGGPGTYSVLIAKANPGISCTVLDLPDIAEIAAELIGQLQMSDRVQTLPGNYRTTAFPTGNDAVIIFGALHQESEESAREILKRAHDSLQPGGIIYVMDMMTDETHTAPVFSALFAVNMALTAEHGWVFSDSELQSWMEDAGFTDFAVNPLDSPMPHWLASAQKN